MSDQPNNPAHMKAAFLQLIATAAWDYFRKFTEAAIRDLERKSVDEDDEDKARTYRADARGARKFWAAMQERIYAASTQNTEEPEDPADDFYAIVPEKPNVRSETD